MKKMVKKKGAIIFSLTVMVLLAWIVIAATNEQSAKLVSPALETNHSSGLSLVNFTFENGTAGLDVETHIGLLNATIYYNITPTEWGIIANTTQCDTFNGVATNVSCWGNLNLSVNGSGDLIPDGYYKLNATIRNGSVLAEEYRQGIGHSGNLSIIRIDTTQPGTAAFQILTSGNNHSTNSNSGNLTLNVSATDGLSGIETVMFFFINETGSLGGNASVRGVREGGGNGWSTSINTSHLLDGVYNITLLVNDTAGNHNVTVNTSSNSAYILTKIRIDNKNPVASASCSPTIVDVDDAFPCSCSGSDVTAGINSTSGSSTSPDGIGIPKNTGSFTYTCSAIDRAANSHSSTATYTVQSSGGSSGSSGSGSGGSGGGPGLSPGSDDEEETAEDETVGTGTDSGDSSLGTGEELVQGMSNNSLWIIILIVIVIVVGVIVYYIRKNN